MELSERIQKMAELVCGMKYYEWRKIATAIDQKK